MDHVQRDPAKVFNNGLAPSETGAVDKIQVTDAPQIASAKAKGLSETCQKYVFTKPFTKETLGVDKLETKHKVFNVFFVTAGVVLFPAMLPLSAARLSYVAHMEAKNMKKGQESIKQSLESCDRLGIQIPANSELGKKITELRDFHNSKHITDKPFIKLSNEVIKGLNELHATKRNEMDKELVGLVGLCREKGFIKGSGETLEFMADLNSLPPEIKEIVGGKTEKISMQQELKVINELKDKMEDIPVLKAAMPKAEVNSVITNLPVDENNEEAGVRSGEDEAKSSSDADNRSQLQAAIIQVNINSTEQAAIIQVNINSTESEEAGVQSRTEIKPDANVEPQVAIKAEEKPIPPLDIKPLTEEEVVDFAPDGNAMKDFISCGVGFTYSEVSVDGTTQLTKKIHEDSNGKSDVDAETIAMGLIAIYPKVVEKEDGVEVRDRVLRDLENAITEANPEAPEEKKFSATGGLAQSERVLDITIAMIESNMYNPLINQDLAKADQSRIRNIIDQSSKFPELQAKKEKLERLVLNQASSITEIKTNPDDVPAFKASLDNVRNGTLQGPDLDALAESMAQDSKEIAIYLFKNMDGREALNPQDGRRELNAYSDKLSYFAAKSILDCKTPEEVKNTIEFFTKVAQSSLEKGDFFTAGAIVIGALQAGSITNLTCSPSGGAPFVTLNQTHQVTETERKERGKTGYKDLDDLKDLFDPKGGFVNLRPEQAKFEGAVPFIAITSNDLDKHNTSSDVVGSGSSEKLKKMPDPEHILTMGNTIKDISIASGLKGGKAENCKGFSTLVLNVDKVIDPSDESKTITISLKSAMEGELYTKSKALRSSVVVQQSPVEEKPVKVKRQFQLPFASKPKTRATVEEKSTVGGSEAVKAKRKFSLSSGKPPAKATNEIKSGGPKTDSTATGSNTNNNKTTDDIKENETKRNPFSTQSEKPRKKQEWS